jgi:hypothetical protein
MASKLSAFLSPSWSVKTLVPRGATTKLQLGGLFAGDCHCCSHRAVIFWFAIIEMATGRLWSSGGTHRCTQEIWEMERGSGSGEGGVVGRG